MFLIAASRAAQPAATVDAGEPSTATTIPSSLTGVDNRFSLHRDRRYPRRVCQFVRL
jgi:hypothetical protein